MNHVKIWNTVEVNLKYKHWIDRTSCQYELERSGIALYECKKNKKKIVDVNLNRCVAWVCNHYSMVFGVVLYILPCGSIGWSLRN